MGSAGRDIRTAVRGAGHLRLSLGSSRNRLPAVASAAERVVLGELPEHFRGAFGVNIEAWQPVEAPARRRQWHYDGADTLAVHVASASDIDDVIPTLVAYQIEWNKLHARLKTDAHVRALVENEPSPDVDSLEVVRRTLGIAPDDWQPLWRGLGICRSSSA